MGHRLAATGCGRGSALRLPCGQTPLPPCPSGPLGLRAPLAPLQGAASQPPPPRRPRMRPSLREGLGKASNENAGAPARKSATAGRSKLAAGLWGRPEAPEGRGSPVQRGVGHKRRRVTQSVVTTGGEINKTPVFITAGAHKAAPRLLQSFRRFAPTPCRQPVFPDGIPCTPPPRGMLLKANHRGGSVGEAAWDPAALVPGLGNFGTQA